MSNDARSTSDSPAGAGSAPPSAMAAFVTPLLYVLTFAVMLIRLVSLRFVTEAADDHSAPLDFILASGKLPRMGDCFECYHPKLFYVIQADLIRGLHIDDRLTRLQVAALTDWVGVAVVAAMLYVFLRWQRLTPLQRALSFALPISAPGVTIISTQPSNDGLVAGLSAIAIVAFWRWNGGRAARWLALSLIAGSLAAASKGSGLVILAGVLAGLVLQGFRFWRAHLAQAALALALAAVGTVFVGVSGFYVNYRDSGSILAGNVPKSGRLPFFTTVRSPSAGANSIADAYLDFPILSALRVPYVGYADSLDTPPHRQNLWTMMLGNHSYSRFQLWPSSWHSTEPLTVNVGRIEIALGLLPLGLLVLGLCARLAHHLKALATTGLFRVAADRDVWITSVVVVFLAMMLNLTANYHWSPSMKAFYTYPGLVAFAAVFARGLTLVRRRWMENGIAAVGAAIVGLNGVDACLLTADLSRSFIARATPLAGFTNTIADDEVDLVTPLAAAKPLVGKVRAGGASNGDVAFCDRALHDRVVGATSPSDVELKLDVPRSRFRATACNAARAPKRGTYIVFRVMGDNTVLWDSGVVAAGQTRDVDVSIAGVSKLRLVVVTLDHSDEDAPLWIDPRVR